MKKINYQGKEWERITLTSKQEKGYEYIEVSMWDYKKDICYSNVKLLSDCGIKQVNIHQLVAKETIDQCHEVLDDIKNDKRLAKLNAVVFLGLKKKGNRNTLNIADQNEFDKLILRGLNEGLPIGCDSCSANKFMNVLKNNKQYMKFTDMVEPCESTLFSMYIDTKGHAYPCSFVASTNTKGLDLRSGIDLTSNSITKGNFLDTVWNSNMYIKFRGKLKKSCRSCPVYEV